MQLLTFNLIQDQSSSWPIKSWRMFCTLTGWLCNRMSIGWHSSVPVLGNGWSLAPQNMCSRRLNSLHLCVDLIGCLKIRVPKSNSQKPEGIGSTVFRFKTWNLQTEIINWKSSVHHANLVWHIPSSLDQQQMDTEKCILKLHVSATAEEIFLHPF